jgi:hypothetical protein
VACHGNPEILASVSALFQEHEREDNPIDKPVVSGGPLRLDSMDETELRSSHDGQSHHTPGTTIGALPKLRKQFESRLVDPHRLRIQAKRSGWQIKDSQTVKRTRAFSVLVVGHLPVSSAAALPADLAAVGLAADVVDWVAQEPLIHR